MEKLLLECGLEGCKPTATPGVRASFEEVEKDAELPREQHSAFRAAAARGNYLAADCLDCQFACKEMQGNGYSDPASVERSSTDVSLSCWAAQVSVSV